MRHVNSLRLSKFRTGAENDKEKICYYNYNKKTGCSIDFWPLENKY